MFPRVDLYGTDPAQHLTTADWDLDHLDHDLSVGLVKYCTYESRTVIETAHEVPTLSPVPLSRWHTAST